jgi:hypothetical protein
MEAIIVEIHLDREKWIFPLIYKPPASNSHAFCDELSTLLDKCLLKSTNIVLLGDLNQDLLKPNTHGRDLSDVNDLFDLRCLITEPICFKDTPSRLDVFLTTRPDQFLKAGTIESGISDFHKVIYAVKKAPIPPRKADIIQFRSYKSYKRGRLHKGPSYYLHTFVYANYLMT